MVNTDRQCHLKTKFFSIQQTKQYGGVSLSITHSHKEMSKELNDGVEESPVNILVTLNKLTNSDSETLEALDFN